MTKNIKISHVVIGFFVGVIVGMFFAGHLWIAYASKNAEWIVQHQTEEDQ
jgi:hypothetical protein